MGTNGGRGVSVASFGYRIPTPFGTPPDRSLAQVQAITASTITFELTGVASAATSVKIGYRLHKRYNPDDFLLSTAITTPVIGDTVTISGLEEGQIYECMPFGYDLDGSQSEPGNIMHVIPTGTTKAMRDACYKIKTIMQTAFDTELTDMATARGETYTSIASAAMFDTAVSVTNQVPYLAVIAQETELTEKIGNRKWWRYRINIEVCMASGTYDYYELVQTLEVYMKVIEQVIDKYPDLSSTVWEAEVDRKMYMEPFQDNQTGMLIQKGMVQLYVDQTN